MLCAVSQSEEGIGLSPAQMLAAIVPPPSIPLSKRLLAGAHLLGIAEWGENDLFENPATVEAVAQASFAADLTDTIAGNVLTREGVEFIDETGGGAGVRLRKPGKSEPKKKGVDSGYHGVQWSTKTMDWRGPLAARWFRHQTWAGN